MTGIVCHWPVLVHFGCGICPGLFGTRVKKKGGQMADIFGKKFSARPLSCRICAGILPQPQKLHRRIPEQKGRFPEHFPKKHRVFPNTSRRTPEEMMVFPEDYRNNVLFPKKSGSPKPFPNLSRIIPGSVLNLSLSFAENEKDKRSEILEQVQLLHVSVFQLENSFKRKIVTEHLNNLFKSMNNYSFQYFSYS